MPTRGKGQEQVVELKPLSFETAQIPIIGVTELIVHNWSAKAKRQMLDKHMGKATLKRELKVPEEDYQSGFHVMPDGGYGFPAVGFKAAIVTALRQYEAATMTAGKVAIFVQGELFDEVDCGLVRIYGVPRMREDMVKIGMDKPDIRFRPGFPKWKAMLTIKHNTRIVSSEILVNLVQAGGFGGVGEWRPSAPNSYTGSYGMFRVATMEEWEGFKMG